jgi:glycine cleavage system H protein
LSDYESPDDLRYSKEDEWARQDDDRVVVGITDYAQQQLGDIVFLELPEVGANISQGDSVGVIESVKAVSDLYTPVSGEVVEVNTDLNDSPEVINAECYGAGWILAVACNDEEEIESLMDAGAYLEYVEERSE